MLRFGLILTCLISVTVPVYGQEASAARLIVTPSPVRLVGRAARQQLLVSVEQNGKLRDVTRTAQFETASNTIRLQSGGVVAAVADGSGQIAITSGELRIEVPVEVVEAARPTPVSFELDVIPIFTRLGCNAGACHGKSRGQNGFQLSLLGFYPELDYAALTKEARGRRVFPPAPGESLLLRKGAGLDPHGGGKRMDAASPAYEMLARWIAQGLPRTQPTDPRLERIAVSPAERLLDNLEEQQLQVTAYYSDGSSRDVTALAAYQSNESTVVAVNETGLLTAGPVPGEAAVMARFMGQVAVSNVMIPLPGQVPAEFYSALPRQNFIDPLVWDKLQRLSLTPAAPAPDHKYLRRVYLDIIGRLPSPEETRTFLADAAPNKREQLVDRLLQRPEYADHWASKWADLLRPNPYRVGIKAVFNYDNWIREQFRKNVPYDQFVRQLVTAQGSTYENGAVTLYRDRREPEEQTTIISQLFLGIRLECAKCHHHPFERYGQEDFYSFAAYFARIGRKGVGISPPISGSEEIFFTNPSGQVKHPITGEVLPPRPLFGTAPEVPPEADPRESLARWITADDNPFFAQVMANRIWADLMGRGLVEPVDDLRGTNPPTNGPLLAALADEFRRVKYDQKQLIRAIVTSYVYSLDSLPTERNITDTRNYSRHYRQRLRAETLLDGVCDITQIPERFDGVPPGSRATGIWTTRVGSLFLDSFGRPDPNQDPPCERTGDTTVVQALHLMNSAELHRKVTDDNGRAARLAASEKTPAELVDELYLLAYSRFPTDEERQFGVSLYGNEGSSRRLVTEDLLWALINTPEFIFKD